MKHRMYCAKSGMACAVFHSDGGCPDVRDCEGCKAERSHGSGEVRANVQVKSKLAKMNELESQIELKVKQLADWIRTDLQPEYIEDEILALVKATHKEAEAKGYKRGLMEWQNSQNRNALNGDDNG